MNPKEVIPYIEGEPLTGIVPVENGMTNTEREEQGQRVVGFNSENSEIKEGLVRFDFANTNYDDIKRVFSIWICMKS